MTLVVQIGVMEYWSDGVMFSEPNTPEEISHG